MSAGFAAVSTRMIASSISVYSGMPFIRRISHHKHRPIVHNRLIDIYCLGYLLDLLVVPS